MPTEPTIELSCLVLCTEGPLKETLRELMVGHPCVKDQYLTGNHDKLRESLRTKSVSLVVVVLKDTSQHLPACLLRYPDLQILVVAPSRKIGLVDNWLAQGATDIVSSHHEDRLRHTLNRMLNECITHAKLKLANSRLATQYKLQQILLNTYAEAVMLWQNGSVIEANDCFDTLIGCKQHDNKGRTIEWKRWVSAPSHKDLHDSALLQRSELTIVSASMQQHRVRVESLILEGGPAQLIRIDPSPGGINNSADLATDSVTGLLVRGSFTRQLQSLMRSTNSDRRITAILITLPIPENASHFSGVDRTLQDLLIYRAANTIEQRFKDNTLLGRTGVNTLLLARPSSNEQSRKLALRVKAAIGSLGGLIEDPRSVHIKTLTLTPNTLSASEVMERLERPFAYPGKKTRSTAGKPAASLSLSLGA